MLFVDSGYFVALWDPKDDHHDEAVLVERTLKEEGGVRGLQDYTTCLPMVWEVIEHLSHTLSAQAAAENYARIMKNCKVITPTERDVRSAFEGTFRLYLSVPKRSRPPGMIDSIGVAVMRRTKVLRILSFDSGFDLVPDIRRIHLVKDGHGSLALTGSVK